MKKHLLLFFITLSISLTCHAERYTVLETDKCGGGPNGYDYVDAFNQGTMTTLLGDRVTRRKLLCKEPGPKPCNDGGYVTGQNFDQVTVEQEVALEVAGGNNSGQKFADGTYGTETVSTFDISTATTPCYLWEANGTCTTIIIFDLEQD